MTDRQTNRQTDRDRETDRQIQRDRQRQAQTDRQRQREVEGKGDDWILTSCQQHQINSGRSVGMGWWWVGGWGGGEWGATRVSGLICTIMGNGPTANRITPDDK